MKKVKDKHTTCCAVCLSVPHSDDDDVLFEQHVERFDAVHKHHPEVRADTPRRCVIELLVFALSSYGKQRRKRNENAAPS